MANRKHKTSAQRRAAGEFQLAIALVVILAPLSALLWPVTLASGYASHPLNLICELLFAVNVSGTFFALLFAWLASDAWSRK